MRRFHRGTLSPKEDSKNQVTEKQSRMMMEMIRTGMTRGPDEIDSCLSITVIEEMQNKRQTNSTRVSTHTKLKNVSQNKQESKLNKIEK